MRSPPRARWLICAIALSSMPSSVLADDDTPAKKKKPKLNIDDCASFTQLDREEEDGVDFAIASSCEVKLACGIKWTLVCAPGTKQSKKTRGAVAFELDTGGSDGATASAGTCGYHGWEIRDISWSCEPVP